MLKQLMATTATTKSRTKKRHTMSILSQAEWHRTKDFWIANKAALLMTQFCKPTRNTSRSNPRPPPMR
jgi:hypothetical protein